MKSRYCTIMCNRRDCGQVLLPIRPTEAILNEKLLELVNRKWIIFQQYNTRPYVSLMTRQILLKLGWEVLIEPLFSLHIAPLDFHLFWSLQNFLSGKNFNSLEDGKKHLEQFFVKNIKFWGRRNYEVAWKMAEGNGTKEWIHCSTKLLVKLKNVFNFYLKIKWTFGPTQYLINKDLWHCTRNSDQYSLKT